MAKQYKEKTWKMCIQPGCYHTPKVGSPFCKNHGGNNHDKPRKIN